MKFALFPNLLANSVPSSSQWWITSFIKFMFLPKIFNRILSDKIQKYLYFYVRKADFQPWESEGGSSRHNENILHLLFLIYVWVRTYAFGMHYVEYGPVRYYEWFTPRKVYTFTCCFLCFLHFFPLKGKNDTASL